ncbi:hypothetical protein, partial [Adlercreutzia rubneri]
LSLSQGLILGRAAPSLVSGAAIAAHAPRNITPSADAGRLENPQIKTAHMILSPQNNSPKS